MYKLVIFSVLILCIHTSHSATPETKVRGIVRKIQDVIPEPIKIRKYAINIPENDFISGYLILRNFVASGLKDFYLKVKFMLFGIIPDDFNFHLDKFEVNTGYNLSMTLFNFDVLKIFGQGNVYFGLSDLTVNGSITMDKIHPLKKLKLSIGNMEYGITGLMNDKDLSVNSDSVASVAENLINGITALVIKKSKKQKVSGGEANKGTTALILKYMTDLVSSFNLG